MTLNVFVVDYGVLLVFRREGALALRPPSSLSQAPQTTSAFGGSQHREKSTSFGTRALDCLKSLDGNRAKNEKVRRTNESVNPPHLPRNAKTNLYPNSPRSASFHLRVSLPPPLPLVSTDHYAPAPCHPLLIDKHQDRIPALHQSTALATPSPCSLRGPCDADEWRTTNHAQPGRPKGVDARYHKPQMSTNHRFQASATTTTFESPAPGLRPRVSAGGKRVAMVDFRQGRVKLPFNRAKDTKTSNGGG